MIWLTWRQFRAQTLTVLVILAAATTFILITGAQVRDSYTADLISCTPLGDCGDVLGQLEQHYMAIFQLAQLFLIVAPALIGIFWGAPLIGRELENGTEQLAWNQSVTRTRWLAVKLTGVGFASAGTAGLLSYLLTWWAGPFDQINGDRWAAMTFTTRDVVPLAYAAFAFALGTTTGLLLRRTLPAMAITLAVFIGIQILMPTLVRPHLLPSTTISFPINQTTARQSQGIEIRNGGSEIYLRGLPVAQGAWVLSTPPIEDSSGQVASATAHQDCFPLFASGQGQGAPQGEGLRPAKGDGPDLGSIGACLEKSDLHESVTYQPASHYWPLQWLESAIFVACAAVLAAFCFWWIRRRQN
jgi:ABC-type transport system involved in multi-copper enzyme maturation permease subunit